MIIESRTRYSFWTALGDVGGFHDGLTLLMKVFMASIAAISYENDLLKGNLFEEHLTPDQKYSRRKLAKQVSSSIAIDGPILRQNSNMEVFLHAISSLKPAKLGLCHSILDCICRGVRRRRRQKDGGL